MSSPQVAQKHQRSGGTTNPTQVQRIESRSVLFQKSTPADAEAPLWLAPAPAAAEPEC